MSHVSYVFRDVAIMGVRQRLASLTYGRCDPSI